MVTYQVSASADDGFAQSATVQDTTAGYLKIGDERTYAVPYQMSAMRFGNVNIPRSAVIIDARLKISSIDQEYRGQIYGVIQAESADDAADFSSRYIADANKTITGIDWDHKTAWTPNTYYTGPDISTVIQEVVNRPGFSSGNSMAIYYSTRDLSGKARSFASYEYSPTLAAVLEVNYETYTISGHILTTEATPLEGVSLSAGANIESTETDASGYYELKVPPSWSGTVTPNKTDWGFSPVNQPYSNVSSDQVSEDYTAFQPNISGYVKDGSGTGIEGVSVSADNGGGSDSTDSSGYYEIIVPYDWTGTISVSKTGWGFTEWSHSYTTNVTSDLVNQDFTAFQPIISGYVKDGSGAGIDGVSVSADNGGGSYITNTSGYYEIVVPYDWSGTVTPNRLWWEITPSNRSYSNVTADQVDQDFTAVYVGIIVKPDGTGDFNNIQAAIDTAVDGELVIVHPGTYYEAIHFQGKNIILRSTDPNDPNLVANTIIDADELGIVVTFSGTETSNCQISGFTITGGYGYVEYHYGGAYYGPAGGIYGNGAEASINNCKITGNNGPGLLGCDGTISNCSISDNRCGVYLCYGTISHCVISNNSYSGLKYCNGTISNCTISANSAYENGGGLYRCNAVITNCIILGNEATRGGGLYLCNAAMTNCTITGNSADYGGGWCWGASSINNCTILNNSAAIDGGGLYGFNGTMNNCMISGNTAGDKGGGLCHCYGTIESCTVSSNSANYGGGLYACDSSIQNCTVSGNSANYGGGLYDCDGTKKNCIVWGNTALDIGDQIFNSSSPSYCCIEDWAGGGIGNISDDPLFVDDANGDYHLSSGSPCINSGDPNYIAEPNETDIDGDPRVVVRIDMGIDEFFVENSAALFISQSNIEFVAEGIDSNTIDQTIKLFNCGAHDLNWQVIEDCDWLSVIPPTGQTASLQTSEITINAYNDHTNYGLRSSQLEISDPNAVNSPQTVTVTLNVLGPELTVSPSQFYFETALDEPNTTGQILSIQNVGYDTLYWDIYIPAECNWLNASEISGQSTGELDEVILSIDHNEVEAGFYEFDITVSDPNADNSPQMIPVEVQVLSHKGERHVPAEYETIQEAVDAAVDDDEIIVHPGKYTGPGNSNIDFIGKAITVRSIEPNNPAIVAATIIEGHGFSFLSGEGPNSVLDGLTITGGFSGVGGGIWCRYSSPTIRNCIIRDCFAGSHGGGIGLEDSNSTISNCIVTGNLTSEIGGGIACVWGGSPIIENCVITGNSVGWAGGGIGAIDCNLTVKNCTLSNNTVESDFGGFGGAICVGGGIVTINNSILWDDDANEGTEIAMHGSDPPSTASVSYSDVQGGLSAISVDPCCTLEWDDGNNLDIDPCFAEPGFWHPNDTSLDANDDFWVDGDYHLKSQTGRWQWSKYIGLDPTGDGFINLSDFAAFANSWQTKGGYIPADLDRSGFVDLSDLKHLLDNYLVAYPPGEWVFDDVTSPCIDAGDPNSDWTAELWPHGKRINMGAYGGTPQASMSNSTVGNIANLDNDISDVVDYNDLGIFLGKWCRQQVLLTEDFNRDGVVNSVDYGIFANNWLAGTMP